MCRKSLSLVILMSVLALGVGVRPTWAMANERRAEIPSYGRVHYWQMKQWADNTVQCELFLEHNEFPTNEDIETYCGTQSLAAWNNTPPCAAVSESGQTQSCAGSFMVDYGLQTLAYTKLVPLPRAKAQYTLDSCGLNAWCADKPIIRFYGVEPLSNFSIQAVHVQVGSRQITCSQTDCLFSVPATDSRGMWVDYWAVSNYGDESPHVSLHIRNLTRKVDGKTQSRVEILDANSATDPGSTIWDAFPTAAHPDGDIYAQVDNPAELATQNHLYYLAGKLIFTGKVDPGDCITNGLLANGMANTCGEEKAFALTVEYQNRFDPAIYQAAVDNDVPARLLKGVIAQESQFWPDTDLAYEFGIGSVSENGVDMLLTVDEASFLGVCLENFERPTCSVGYTNMTKNQRAILRGLVLRAVDTKAEVDLLARILRTSAVQVGEIIHKATGKAAGSSSTYEDLWDLSIANYNGGAGCIESGIKTLVDSQLDITFQNFAQINTTCPAVSLYVENVKNYAR